MSANKITTPVPSKAWGIAGLLAVAVIPLAVGMEMPLTQKRSITITPFEPVIWITALWLLIAWVKSGSLTAQLKKFCIPAIPAFLLIAAALVSAINTDFSYENSKALFAKTLIQWIEYLVLGVLVFHTLLSDETWRKRAVMVFCISGTLTIASVIVMAEYYGKTGHFQGGWLLNHNSYGIYLVLLIPVMMATPYFFKKCKGLFNIFGVLIIICGLYFCTSGGLFLGACIALVIMVLGAEGASGISTYLIMLILSFTFVASMFFVPESKVNDLIDSVQVYVPFEDPDTGAVSREHTMRYYRWSANLEMLAENPFTGVGLGQYGKRVNEYYTGINLPSGRTDIPELYNVKTNEPFTFGWFFLIASELGLVGVAVLLFLFADLMRNAVEKITIGDWGGWVVLAVLAGLGIAGWFTSPMVRGVGGALAFIMALAWSRVKAVEAPKSE